MSFDVTMPDGTVIHGVPEGTTQEQLMAQYSAMPPAASTPDAASAPDSVAGSVASIGSGLLRLGPDIYDAVSKMGTMAQPGGFAPPALAPGATNIFGVPLHANSDSDTFTNPLPSSDPVRSFLAANTYQPQNRLERDISGGSEAAGAIASGQPVVMGLSAAGGALANELSTEMPGLPGTPEQRSMIGSVAPFVAAAAAHSVPALLGAAVSHFGFGPAGHAITSVADWLASHLSPQELAAETEPQLGSNGMPVPDFENKYVAPPTPKTVFGIESPSLPAGNPPGAQVSPGLVRLRDNPVTNFLMKFIVSPEIQAGSANSPPQI